MSEHGIFLWQRATLPDGVQAAKVCRQFGIKRVAVKVLDGAVHYNVQGGDAGLRAYLDVLRENGLTVEGWGYHYPTNPGAQGDAIEERREKMGFSTYHLDIEGEWASLAYGGPAAMKLLLSKVKTNGFELLVCSYRFPSVAPAVPWSAMAYHENVDGWSPQVYWALENNPVEQWQRCVSEYNGLPVWKPLYPVGPVHGGPYSGQYWEPKLAEVEAFRGACEDIPRVYWYSLDWVMEHNRLDLLEAATGINNGVVVPPPVPPGERWATMQVDQMSVRYDPEFVAETLFAKGLKGKRVRVMGAAVNGYVPVSGWVWEKSLRYE